MNRACRLIALSLLSTIAAAQAGAQARQTVVKYMCNGGSATAVYDTTSPTGGAVVTYDGNKFAFKSAMSGSGARYTTRVGPHAVPPLEWWTKGPGATLSELKPGTNRLIATCNQLR